jgi:hypothetical protein
MCLVETITRTLEGLAWTNVGTAGLSPALLLRPRRRASDLRTDGGARGRVSAHRPAPVEGSGRQPLVRRRATSAYSVLSTDLVDERTWWRPSGF